MNTITNSEISIKGLLNNSLKAKKMLSIVKTKINLEIKLADRQIQKSNALIKPKFSIVNTLLIL